MSPFALPLSAARWSRRVAPVAAIGLALTLAACKEEVAQAPEIIRPVKVVTAVKSAETRPVVYSGTVKARTEAALGFRVAGKLIERRVNIGDAVAAGTVLARLDRSDLNLTLASAEANVEAAKARRDVATDALARAKTLFDKGFVAKAVLDQRALELDQASSAYDAAVSSRDQASHQTDYAELKTDVAGIVTELRADAGQVVAAGAPVVVVARNGETEVAVAVPEQDVRHFRIGDTLKIGYFADPSISQTGTIREIAGSADPQSRTFAVRVSLGADPRVRLGMTATVTAEVAVAAGGIVIPLTALSEKDGATIVWVADAKSETVSPRGVRVGAVVADGVSVTDGLTPGDLVVAAGTQFMVPGKKVRLADPILNTAAVAAGIVAR